MKIFGVPQNLLSMLKSHLPLFYRTTKFSHPRQIILFVTLLLISSQAIGQSSCVTWPLDVSISCDEEPEPDLTGSPVLDPECGDPLYVNYTDMTNTSTTGTEIQRVWSVNYTTFVMSNTQYITLMDIESPEIVCLSGLAASLDESGQIELTVEDVLLSYDDNCSDVTTDLSQYLYTCEHLGDNTLTVYVQDEAGNYSTCELPVDIQDKAAPVAVCLSNITLTLDENGMAVLDPQAVDNGSYDNCGVVDYSLSQSEFDCSDVGSTVIVELIVSDASGNTSTCSVNVSVADNLGPSLDCPDTIYLECDADTSPESTGYPVIVDNCTAYAYTWSDEIVNTAEANRILRTWTVVDWNNQISQECVQVIELHDTTSPTLTCQQTVTVSLGEQGFANIPPEILVLSAEDNCGTVTFSSSKDYVDCNDLGLNEITITATDGSGNYTNCIVDFYVEDKLAPTVSCVTAITATLASDGTVTLLASDVDQGSSDNCGIAEMSLSKSLFTCADVGVEQAVDFTVSDAAGNSATCTVQVNIQDNGAYCECNSSGFNTSYEYIKKVRLKTIKNKSLDDGGYGDYTALSTVLNAGQSKKIHLKPGYPAGSYNEYWRVWVDWNMDGDFEDSGELEVEVSGVGKVTGFMTVPSDALTGDYTMRVSMKYGGYAEPCEDFNYGEVEDYTISINGIEGLSIQEIEMLEAQALSYQDENNLLISARTTTNITEVKIYPNPTRDYLHFTSKTPSGTIAIFNQMGSLAIPAIQVKDEVTRLDLSELPNGVYYLKYTQGKELTSVRKVIVQK